MHTRLYPAHEPDILMPGSREQPEGSKNHRETRVPRPGSSPFGYRWTAHPSMRIYPRIAHHVASQEKIYTSKLSHCCRETRASRAERVQYVDTARRPAAAGATVCIESIARGGRGVPRSWVRRVKDKPLSSSRTLQLPRPFLGK